MKRLLAIFLLISSAAFAEEEVVDVVEDEGGDGFTADEAKEESLRITGYIDVGLVKATGNGTSFSADDTRSPLDYGADAFAPAVNSRGEVASTDTGGRFTNAFLPRSVGIGSAPSFLINTASADVRFQPRGLPIFLFARMQLMPRLSSTGDSTRVELQQAFGRVSPLKNHELALFLGRFDSVFGIEYLENEANLRPGVTPSLIARYTTGHGLGAKVFYRFQLPAIWSAVSFNFAATNNGTRIEALVPVDASLTGNFVGSGRIGYELNLQHLQVKLGASGLLGPRNDQRSPTAAQMALAGDLRISAYGFSLAGEVLRLIDEHAPAGGKVTGLGVGELASGFRVWGGWGRLSYTLPWKTEVLTGITLLGRYDRRAAQFEGFTEVQTDRFTAGARIDLWDVLAIKLEALFNRELSGAPNVENDVFTSSAVFTW
ncbi:MAG: hypothetical protein Q8N23_04255 [Archangium sp.]|nr:hypothetical protein [Archangium sp.]MDP3151854.1 hypothetical protein [Archangium sp.]MDP3573066.1 hypothetical protein [Archangium sp.]